MLPDVPPGTGTAAGTTLGRIRLGMTQRRAHAAYAHNSDRSQPLKDFFCLTPVVPRAPRAEHRSVQHPPRNRAEDRDRRDRAHDHQKAAAHLHQRHRL